MAAAHKAQQDIEALVAEFVRDPARSSLELPPMSAELRKKAKALVDQHPELKCESFGLGSERRLHLFKAGVPAVASPLSASPVSVKNTFIDDWAPSEGSGDAELVQFRSMPVQLPAGAATSRATPPDSPSKVSLPSCLGQLDLSPISESTPKWPVDTGAGRAHGPVMFTQNQGLPRLLGGPGPKEGLQVRNTFLHYDCVPPDDRTVQSMPHDMFRRCLEEEAALRAAEAAAKPMAAASAAPGPMRIAGSMLSVPAPQPAQCSHEAMLVPGMHVVIQGLTKLPAFNGQRGVIEKFSEATGRYTVVLTAPVPGVPKNAKVKADNLLIDTAATAAAATAAAPPPPKPPFMLSLDTASLDMASQDMSALPTPSGLPSVPSTPLWGEDFFASSPLRLTQFV